VRFSPSSRLIYVSAMAGSRPVRLSTGDSGGVEDAPAWSPDGRWILFRKGGQLVKALASGGTTPTVVSGDVPIVDSQRARWMPDGSVIYVAADGLKQVSAAGGAARTLLAPAPILWDSAPDGRVLYAIFEGQRRAIELATIDVATGAVHTVRSLGRRPLTPDYVGYTDTLRAMRVSPDGTHLMYAFLNPEADIWILENFAPEVGRWWR
jgi:Tol biopolymer transport system component